MYNWVQKERKTLANHLLRFMAHIVLFLRRVGQDTHVCHPHTSISVSLRVGGCASYVWVGVGATCMGANIISRLIQHLSLWNDQICCWFDNSLTWWNWCGEFSHLITWWHWFDLTCVQQQPDLMEWMWWIQSVDKMMTLVWFDLWCNNSLTWWNWCGEFSLLITWWHWFDLTCSATTVWPDGMDAVNSVCWYHDDTGLIWLVVQPVWYDVITSVCHDV